MDPASRPAVGIVYFPALEPLLDAGRDLIDTLEVEPQQYWIRHGGGYRLDDAAFERIGGFPQRKLVHGVGLPVGGSVGLDAAQVEPFLESVQRLDPPWVSEHLAFLRARSGSEVFNTGFLLPPLQSPESVATAAAGLRRLQALVGRPLAFENPTNYLRPLPGELPDGDFLARVCLQSGCGMLLDLHNLWCNERNGRQSMRDALAQLPLDRVWEVHLAGGDSRDGYWLDAHSGLVPAPLMAFCEELFPRLPALRGVTFEIMPEYLRAKSIGMDALLRQLDAIRALAHGSARLRRPRVHDPAPIAARVAEPGPASPQPSQLRPPLPPQAEWESALALAVNRRPPRDPLQQVLAADPGVAVLQQLVANVRAGMLVDLLTLSYRLLVLHLGDAATHALMERYWAAHLPEPFAGREAQRFAAFLRGESLPVPHLDDVLAYELASIEAVAEGRDVQVDLGCDPVALVAALQAGRHPGALPEGRYALTVEA